jgi:glycerol-3-phosphate dehydrogenase
MSSKTDIIVIGGGSTGTGIARDLALRGLKPLLLEKNHLAAGSTGSCHGLLHSGCRYAVSDPHSALECYAENKILRTIASSCIEDTEAMFVSLPEDGLEYQKRFLTSCTEIGIPVEEYSPSKALALEPNLSGNVIGAVKTPDGSINPFKLVAENARAAIEGGGKIMPYTQVTGLIVEGGNIKGVRALDIRRRETFDLYAAFVINAAGAWTHEIVRTIGLSIPMTYSKGSILVFSRRLTETVLHRCHPPSDGDCIVPNETTSLFGTTSIKVDHLDRLTILPHEVPHLMGELGKMVPSSSSARLMRVYAGVRPLYKAKETKDDREISRSFAIIDHEVSHGIKGLVSITGGKMATYRFMAEKAVDLVCEKLGVTTQCSTHLQPLPTSRKNSLVSSGKRLEKIAAESREQGQKDSIVCECEMISRKEIEKVAQEGEVPDLDNIRTQTRVGMGPCQGALCAYRTLGILTEMQEFDDFSPNQILKEFLNRRWRGIKPIVVGDQLREEQFAEEIYAGVFNLDKEVSFFEEIPLKDKFE